ncbi:hypothetical protein RJT34_16777 [Clitoria ternatea]|uniref:Uncharacterized protein n=1 Tax=Clitoria ternatea TaxID=43366 RepID=A0AAN9PCJ2_CLITE
MWSYVSSLKGSASGTKLVLTESAGVWGGLAKRRPCLSSPDAILTVYNGLLEPLQDVHAERGGLTELLRPASLHDGDGINGCYLVDPASSHMLVSKIKPCMRARRRSDTVLVSTINDANQGLADVTFRTPLVPYEKSKSLGSGGSMVCDALRCSGPPTRYTDVFNESIALADRPGKRESSARVDYVPALCTHRTSLLPIEWSGEVFGLRRRGRFAACDVVRSPLNLMI